MEGLRPGAAVVTAKTMRGELQASARLELTPGKTTVWDPVLTEGGVIVGTVVDEDGNPLARMRVWARSEEGMHQSHLDPVTTDEEGAFRLKKAVLPSYDLHVQDSRSEVHRSAPLLESVAPGGEPVRIVFDARDLARSRLVAHLSGPEGEPLEVQMVDLRRFAGDGSDQSGLSRNEVVDGLLTTGWIPAGRYGVTVWTSAFGRWFLGTFDVPPNQEVDLGSFACPDAGVVRLRVLDEEGAPVPEASVHLVREGDPGGTVTSVRNGEGESAPLQPGSYWASFWGGDLPEIGERVEVRSARRASS